MDHFIREPYRLLFPLGLIYFFWGGLVWVPLLWDPGIYPVDLHRYLMLNGFIASFIGGFAMTALPSLTGTWPAKASEVLLFAAVGLLGLVPVLEGNLARAYLYSFLQPLTLLSFILPRFAKRKGPLPGIFIGVFLGLGAWALSALLSMVDPDSYRSLHYDGALVVLIFGVGGKLFPTILGYTPADEGQTLAERWFFVLVVFFLASFFFTHPSVRFLQAGLVLVVALRYWRLGQFPGHSSALARCLWGAAWLVVASFILRLFVSEGEVHLAHALFISAITLLCLLVATRVLVAHGPRKAELEEGRRLYVITGLIVLAAATRVSAYLLPELYLSHLSYSALILLLAAGLWAQKYLRYVR